MTNRILALVLALLLAGVAVADVSIDAPVSVDEYTFVKLTAKGDTKEAAFAWRVYNSAGKRLPPGSVLTNQGKALFVGPPGDYRVELMVFRLDGAEKKPTLEEAEKTITIKGVIPPPPGPGPAPPPPNDPLTKALQDAYGAETDASKATHIQALAALYRQSADDAFLSKCQTWGACFDAMATAAQSLGVAGKLHGVQVVVQAELRARLPAKRDEPLTFDGKALASTTFLRIANNLGAVK